MKAEIVTSQFTVMADGYQIDICYLWSSNWMEIYIDGELITYAKFNPARVTLSYTNILHVAIESLKHHHKKIDLQNQNLRPPWKVSKVRHAPLWFICRFIIEMKPQNSMNRQQHHKERRTPETEFEFEKRDRIAMARLRATGRRVGCAIIIITGLWTFGRIVALLQWLLNDWCTFEIILLSWLWNLLRALVQVWRCERGHEASRTRRSRPDALAFVASPT